MKRPWNRAARPGQAVATRRRWRASGLVVALLVMIWLREAWVIWAQVERVPYSEFLQHPHAERLASVVVEVQFIEARLKHPLPDGRSRLVTLRVAPELAAELAPFEVAFEARPESKLLRDLLSWVVPAAVMFGFWAYLARRWASQAGWAGCSRWAAARPGCIRKPR